jgi:hypothetical protein
LRAASSTAKFAVELAVPDVTQDCTMLPLPAHLRILHFRNFFRLESRLPLKSSPKIGKIGKKSPN